MAGTVGVQPGARAGTSTRPGGTGWATGHVQGQVINPTGNPQGGGNINLSTDNGTTFKYTFHVDANGKFSGDVAPGTYSIIYREPKRRRARWWIEVKP